MPNGSKLLMWSDDKGFIIGALSNAIAIVVLAV